VIRILVSVGYKFFDKKAHCVSAACGKDGQRISYRGLCFFRLHKLNDLCRSGKYAFRLGFYVELRKSPSYLKCYAASISRYAY